MVQLWLYGAGVHCVLFKLYDGPVLFWLYTCPVQTVRCSGSACTVSVVFKKFTVHVQCIVHCPSSSYTMVLFKFGQYGGPVTAVLWSDSSCTMVHIQLPNGTFSSVRWSMWLYDKHFMNFHDLDGIVKNNFPLWP
jgi:hypothetical protein